MASNGVGGPPSLLTAGSQDSLPSIDKGVIVCPASEWLRTELERPETDEMEHAEDSGAEGHEHEKSSLFSSLPSPQSSSSWRVAQASLAVKPASGCGR